MNTIKSFLILPTLVFFSAGFLYTSALAVYAAEFTQDDASGSFTPVVEASQLGSSLAHGDFNGDGYADLVMSAPYESSTYTEAGQIYVFNGGAGIQLQSAQPIQGGSITPSATITGDNSNERIGNIYGVNNSGLVACDFDADGMDDLLFSHGLNVDIFYGSSSTWNAMQLSDAVQLTASNSVSVVACGDVNHDGYDDVIEADYANTVNVVYGGSSRFTDATLSTVADVSVTQEAEGESFGLGNMSVGDLNGDGFADIVVADQADSSDGANTGALYIFYGDTITSGVNSSVGVEITGTSVGLQLGYYMGIGDITGDSKDELFVESPIEAKELIFQGSSTRLVSGAFTDKYTTQWSTAYHGEQYMVSDVNGDGIGDAIVGGFAYTLAPDEVFVVYGTEGSVPTTVDFNTPSTYSLYIGDSSQNDSNFGNAMTIADINADGLNELYVGAKYAASNNGIVYAYNFGSDVDHDGYLSNEGSHLGSDCDDADAAAFTVYYEDADADSLGNSAVTTCGGESAPSGYVADTTDTNDHDFDNDGVEGDAWGGSDCDDADAAASVLVTWYQDADDNGLGNPVISQVFCENVEPSGYVLDSSDVHDAGWGMDLTNASLFTDTVSEVVGLPYGQVQVTFTDSSVQIYTVFPNFTGTKLPKIKQYGDTGYILVLHPKGRKIKLVNPYTGEILDAVKLSDKKYTKNSLKVLDVRHDGSLDIVVTSKKKGTVKVSLLTLNTDTANLKKKDSIKISGANHVKVKKTKAPDHTITLRNKNGRVLVTLKVNSSYLLSNQPE